MIEAPSHRRRWQAAMLVAWLSIPGLASAAGPRGGSTVESRFDEGKQHFGERRYLEAAEAFTEVLGRVKEELLNRPTRENVMLNVLLAYEWAYRSSTDDEGRKDPALLDAGQQVLDEYRAELLRVYPSHADPSDSLAEAVVRYEEARRIAHETYGDQPEPEPGPEPAADSNPPPLPSDPGAHEKGCGGGNEPSVAWLGVIALPIVRRRRRALGRPADRPSTNAAQ